MKRWLATGQESLLSCYEERLRELRLSEEEMASWISHCIRSVFKSDLSKRERTTFLHGLIVIRQKEDNFKLKEIYISGRNQY